MEGESISEPTPKEAAAMAAHVYGDKKDDILIGGWKVSQRTFENVKLNDKDSGFKSQIYEKTVEGKTEYVYATAGTEDGKDWKANALQTVGASKQHTISAKNAQEIASQLEKTGEELTFTGHSLGGGLSSIKFEFNKE